MTTSSADARQGDVVVRAMTEQDWTEVREVYAAGIATGHATFESDPPS